MSFSFCTQILLPCHSLSSLRNCRDTPSSHFKYAPRQYLLITIIKIHTPFFTNFFSFMFLFPIGTQSTSIHCALDPWLPYPNLRPLCLGFQSALCEIGACKSASAREDHFLFQGSGIELNLSLFFLEGFFFSFSSR